FRIAPDDVARMEPPVLPGFLRGGIVLQIAREEAEARSVAGMPDEQLSVLIDARILAIVIDQPYLDFRFRFAETAAADMPGFAIGNDDGAGARFGHGPGLQQRETEACFKRRVQ